MAGGLEIEQRYGPELRQFCRRMVYNDAVAEEIVQDVLAAACRCSHPLVPPGTDGGKEDEGIPSDPQRLRSWLYRVARNRSIDELRRMKPQLRLSAVCSTRAMAAAGGRALVDPMTTPAGRSIKAERVARAQEALQGLDDDLRSVVIMRVYQDLSREEIADATGLSISGVKARLARAFKLMRDGFSEEVSGE